MERFLPIVGYIQEHALKTPDKTAVIGKDGECTYRELWNHITGIAYLLRDKQVSRGQRIMVEAGHTVEYVSLLYGIHLAGGVSVALEHGIPQERVNEIAAEVHPYMILLGEHPLAQLNADLKNLPACSQQTWELPSGDMLQEILFTTGTTGKTKGVMVTHGAYVERGRSRIAALMPLPDNVWLIPSPMNHAAGLSRLNTVMVHGSTVLLINGFTDLKLFFQSMERYHVTSLYLPPSGIHYILMLASGELAKYDAQLDFITSSSAALPGTDRERLNQILPHVRKFNEYGSSESGPVCFLDYSREIKDAKCVGKPYPGVEVYTVSEDFSRTNSSKEHSGILAVKSRGLFSAYLNAPELTSETLRDGVLYLTDLGYFEDGYLYLLGRRDDVINLGGLKVAPTEIEETALRFPGVDECVCVPFDDKMLGRVLKLFIVMKKGCLFNAEEIASFLESGLEAYKIPKLIEQIDEIPKTFNGKIDRKKLFSL